VPGRELDGVHYAMEYLYDRARSLDGHDVPDAISAAGKHVLVVGGGDTGADCVGHAHRENAASVTQIELLGEPPERRPDDLTPWPRWPVKLRTSYALKEGGERDFAISTTQLTGNGSVQEVHWVQNEGKPPFAAVPGTEESHPAQLVLLAMGFLGPEQGLLDQLGVDRDARSNVKAGAYATSVEGVFAAGDARRGQSLIVWAINEGRQCARVADRYLRSLVTAASDWMKGEASADYPGYDKIITALSLETFETQVEKCAAWIGTPECILDTVQGYRRLIGDFEIASLQVNFNDIRFADAQASMHLFGEQVLPRLKDW